MKIKQVAILGAGGLGAAYGSRFMQAPGFETVFIAEGERAERLARDGLVVNGQLIKPAVVRPQTAVQTADLIVVALKHHQLAGALPDLAPFVGQETTLVSVMNGLDSEAMIGAVYGMDKVLYAIALGIDAVRQGNRIDYSAGGKIFFGDLDNTTPGARVRRVQVAFDEAGIPAESPPDMAHAMWRKFMINVGINQASAVLRAPYGVFQKNQEAQEIMELLMREAMAVANGEGVALGEADLHGWYDFLNTLSPDGKTSMLQDIEAGRKTEVEIFGGKVVELGRKQGTATPANGLVLKMIHVLEEN